MILGTHSHRKEDLKKIPGTNTWIISPFQYFEYVSRVELTFEDEKLDVSGGLVRMGPDRPEAPDIAEQVSTMQGDLEADPQYAARFEKLGQAAVELSDANVSSGESVLGNWVQDTVRVAAGANLAVSTASSFRAAIPPGDVTVEDYLTAVPYKNLVLVHELTGAQLQQVLDYSVSPQRHRQLLAGERRSLYHPGWQGCRRSGAADPTASATDQSAFVPLDPGRDLSRGDDRLPGQDRRWLQRRVQAGGQRAGHRPHRQRPDDGHHPHVQPGQRGTGRPHPVSLVLASR